MFECSEGCVINPRTCVISCLFNIAIYGFNRRVNPVVPGYGNYPFICGVVILPGDFLMHGQTSKKMYKTFKSLPFKPFSVCPVDVDVVRLRR